MSVARASKPGTPKKLWKYSSSKGADEMESWALRALWRLAFSGGSTYVDRHIRPLFAVHHDDLAGAQAELLELMQSLTYANEV
jgi:hypothetical protein